MIQKCLLEVAGVYQLLTESGLIFSQSVSTPGLGGGVTRLQIYNVMRVWIYFPRLGCLVFDLQ